eukprot:3636977-Pyramimonas_sp.AAC.1
MAYALKHAWAECVTQKHGRSESFHVGSPSVWLYSGQPPLMNNMIAFPLRHWRGGGAGWGRGLIRGEEKKKLASTEG